MKTLAEYIIDRYQYWSKKNKGDTSNSWRIQHSVECVKRTKFGQQELQLGFFVTCNEKGEPIEKPKTLYISEAHPPSEYESFQRGKQVKEYQTALDNVKFVGWEWFAPEVVIFRENNKERYKVSFYPEYELGVVMVMNYVTRENKELSNCTIESLIATGIELELTEKYKKELGL